MCEECKRPVRDAVQKVPLAAARTAYDVFTFDGCPCFHYEEDGIKLDGHCWRVDRDCKGCGLHYEGDITKARLTKRLLDQMDWYGKWSLVSGRRWPDHG